MLTQKEKEKIIVKHKIHSTDTGSTEVQIGLIQDELGKLVLHLKKNPKDFDSKRGLLRLVAKRRTLLAYLKRESPKRYNEFTKKIGLTK